MYYPAQTPTQQMPTYLPETPNKPTTQHGMQPTTSLPLPNAATAQASQAQQVNIYLITLGVYDPADPIIDSRVWMLSETDNPGMVCPSHIVEQSRDLANPPPYIITLHTKSFSDAVNLFRSDFFLPKSLHSCIKYLHVDHKCLNLLKKGMADEGWRKEFEFSAAALLRVSLRKLRRCWYRVKPLGYLVNWGKDYDTCSVWTSVEVEGFCGVPMGL